jgi:hypothetical protein
MGQHQVGMTLLGFLFDDVEFTSLSLSKRAVQPVQRE